MKKFPAAFVTALYTYFDFNGICIVSFGYPCSAKGPTECCPQGVTKYIYNSKRELNQVFLFYTLHIRIICSF